MCAQATLQVVDRDMRFRTRAQFMRVRGRKPIGIGIVAGFEFKALIQGLDTNCRSALRISEGTPLPGRTTAAFLRHDVGHIHIIDRSLKEILPNTSIPVPVIFVGAKSAIVHLFEAFN